MQNVNELFLSNPEKTTTVNGLESGPRNSREETLSYSPRERHLASKRSICDISFESRSTAIEERRETKSRNSSPFRIVICSRVRFRFSAALDEIEEWRANHLDLDRSKERKADRTTNTRTSPFRLRQSRQLFLSLLPSLDDQSQDQI